MIREARPQVAEIKEGVRDVKAAVERKLSVFTLDIPHRSHKICGFMAEVIIENVSKTFPGGKGRTITALKGVNLTVRDLEFTVVVGPSGSGKTTLLRMIAGLETIDQGRIFLDGRILNGLEPKDRSVAMVFQSSALYPHMTVEENIALPLKLRKCLRPEMSQRTREAAEIVGVGSLLDRAPNSLSGGERQRVALGRAIAQKPSLFLFDEPLSDLDAPMRVHMRREILRVHKRIAATTIYVTHDQVEAMTMGKQIVVMKEGVIQQAGSPLEVYKRPLTRFVAGFIGSPEMNFLEGRIIEDGGLLFRTSFGSNEQVCVLKAAPVQAAQLRKYVDQKVILGVRPENVIIPLNSDRGQLPAQVELIELLGADALVHLRAGTISLMARVSDAEALQDKEKVCVEIDMTRAHFFDPASGLRIA